MKLIILSILIVACSLSGFAQTQEDQIAVKQVALDYIESIYELNPSKMERSIHPGLAKRGFFMARDKSGYLPHKMSAPELIEVARSYYKNGVPKDAAKVVTVFDVADQTASAKVTAIWGIDYLHLAKYDGKWKIINILWQSPPVKPE